MSNLILFSLALNATRDEVAAVVDRIHKTFGIEDVGSVRPTDLIDATTASIVNTVGTPAPTAADLLKATNAATADLDKNGFPWDARIHSSTKAKNADGTWRYRKGVDAGTKTKVENELRTTMVATNLGATIPAAPTAAAVPTPPAAPSLPQPPGLPPMPGANVAPENPAYTAFVRFIAENTHSSSNPTGRLTDEWVGQVLTQYGIAEGSMQNLAHRPDMIPTIEAAIRGALGV